MKHDTYRSRLRDERARLRRELIALRHEVGVTGPDETLPSYEAFGQHGTDQASDLLGREVDRSLELDLRTQLAEVDDAIGRLEREEFGHCAVCGRQIDHERLTALPWARRCVEHEAAAERADQRVLDPAVPYTALEDATESDDEDDTVVGTEPAEEAALHVERER
jgi:RNA polymerase-binding transcription factor DksA